MKHHSFFQLFLVNTVLLCYYGPMRRPGQKILLLLLVLLLLSVPLFCQAADSQAAWVKWIVDSDTLLLTNDERVRLTGVDTPEVHESKKHYRDAERIGMGVKTMKLKTGSVQLIQKV